jgi:hypothetical protein
MSCDMMKVVLSVKIRSLLLTIFVSVLGSRD